MLGRECIQRPTCGAILRTGVVAVLVIAVLGPSDASSVEKPSLDNKDARTAGESKEESRPVQARVASGNKTAKLSCANDMAVGRGEAQLRFDAHVLEQIELSLVALGTTDGSTDGRRASFGICEPSSLRISKRDALSPPSFSGMIHTRGALLLDKPGDRLVLGNLVVVLNGRDRGGVYTTLHDGMNLHPAFDLELVSVSVADDVSAVHMAGELKVAPLWADESGLSAAANRTIGTMTVDAKLVATEVSTVADTNDTTSGQDRLSDEVIGPDIIVADLIVVKYYGSVGTIHAYAVGTHACNIGDQRARWQATTNRHPVIFQNMYRLNEDGFEQIGMSWLKHGFYAVSGSLCSPCNDPTDGRSLGVGCSDPYSATLNGVQNNMSRRSDLNPHTGYFPYPWTAPDPDPVIGKRLQVHAEDLDPDLNTGAQYYIQAHYIAEDDALAGNNDNNASYRPLQMTIEAPGSYGFYPTGQAQRGQPAICAWQDTDPTVVETNIRVPNEGLFILAGKATQIDPFTWRYAYALQNLNSDRSGRSFSVPLPEGAVVTNIGFHDVDYHSGEIYDLTDWPATVSDSAITWSTDSFDANPNANALRFDTLYNFYFDVNLEPATTAATVGLFKPGDPMEVMAATVGPVTDALDCNLNGVVDSCDVDCAIEGCASPCGGSEDCNGNFTPDECEPDCNDNGAVDSCEIFDGTSPDCNGNLIPDGCETDCDGDGSPDDCVSPPDTDDDGVNDCYDLCMTTTLGSKCACPPIGDCCWQNGGWCLPNYTTQHCLDLGGVPGCTPAPCRQGCLLGDSDRDGDIDLADFAGLQCGFSGKDNESSQEHCLAFDYDDDQDVDLVDFMAFHHDCLAE